MKITIKYKGGKIILDVRKLNFFSQYIGLMFKSRENANLLFNYNNDAKRAIHSWFVFFDFLIVWLDSKNKAIGHEIVRPFRTCVKPREKYRKFVEIPLNIRNKRAIRFFVGK